MRYLLILLLFPVSFIQAQLVKPDYIVHYSFQHVTDTNDMTYTDKHPYILFGFKRMSVFMHSWARYNDSIMYNWEHKLKRKVGKHEDAANVFMQTEGLKMKHNLSDLRVLKNFKKNYYQNIVQEAYKRKYSQEPLGLDWEITGDQKKINNFNCILATAQHGGRKYHAWFTTDVPISDGPYVFNGLPGLIIKVTDDQDFYRFELTGLSLNENKNAIFHERFLAKKWVVEISRSEFCKASLNNKENPKLLFGLVDPSPEMLARAKRRYDKRLDLIIEKN